MKIIQNLIMRLASSFDGITIFSKNLEFNALTVCGSLMWLCCFFQNNLFVRWFLNDFFCFQLRLFKTWSCDWQWMCFCLSQRIPQITIKTREKKHEFFFFQEQSKINKETWIFVLNLYFHHFFQKAFFLKNVLF